MALFKVTKKQSGGGDTAPQIIPVYNYHGSNNIPVNYTILEDGLYLIVAANGYQGSRSITLPQNRTAVINQNIAFNGDATGTRGALFVACNLEEGDVLGVASQGGGSWPENGVMVFLLKNITLGSVYDTDSTSDTSLTYTLPSNDNYYLSLGVCMGNGINNFYDSTVDSVAPFLKEQMCIGQNTMITIYLNTGNLTPQLNMYGYDGGGVGFCIVSASI